MGIERDQFNRKPASRMTFAIVAMSVLMRAAKSSGEPPRGAMLWAANQFLPIQCASLRS